MAKSKASFSKKEKEKEKSKKRKEKEERREERKANSNKGKNFEEMFAYVDEFGVISSTPPDKTRTSKIKKEEIQISVPKQEKLINERRKGIVTFFNKDKGFGFVIDDASREKLFFHISTVSGEISESDEVSFTTEYNHRGLTAVDLKK